MDRHQRGSSVSLKAESKTRVYERRWASVHRRRHSAAEPPPSRTQLHTPFYKMADRAGPRASWVQDLDYQYVAWQLKQLVSYVRVVSLVQENRRYTISLCGTRQASIGYTLHLISDYGRSYRETVVSTIVCFSTATFSHRIA